MFLEKKIKCGEIKHGASHWRRKSLFYKCELKFSKQGVHIAVVWNANCWGYCSFSKWLYEKNYVEHVSFRRFSHRSSGFSPMWPYIHNCHFSLNVLYIANLTLNIPKIFPFIIHAVVFSFLPYIFLIIIFVTFFYIFTILLDNKVMLITRIY